MNKKERLQYFKTELDAIQNINIKKFVAHVLCKLPEYFFEVAASSTGKYHPEYSLGNQGLLRHTKAAVKFATELFQNETIAPFLDYERDAIIASLILHDGVKHGLKGSKHTVFDHPLEICKLIANDDKLIAQLNDENVLNLILNCISSHMGQWNIRGRIVLPKPKAYIQKFVHLCDYLASRKCLEVHFDK